jgi:hypothetical protein
MVSNDSRHRNWRTSLTVKNQIVDIVTSTDRIDPSYAQEATKAGDRIAPASAQVDAERNAVAYLESIEAKLPGSGTKQEELLRGARPLAVGVYGESMGPAGVVTHDARPICSKCQNFLTDSSRYGGATITDNQRAAWWPWFYSP